MIPCRTFSIVAADPLAGECGVAVASKFLSVGAVVPWARGGVGAIATQSYANTSYGPTGLGLLAKGGLTLAEAYLADFTGTAANSKYAKITLEAIEEVERAGHTVRHIAKGGGKVLTITGFYFDVEEVLHAKDMVKKIKALIEKTNKEFKAIQHHITSAVKGYQRLQRILVTSEAAARREIENKRRERDELNKRYSYSLIKPVAWKLVDDYSRIGR